MPETQKGSLQQALLDFQKAAPRIALDATNPHFKNKYPTLAGIMDVIRPTLNGVGLTIMQSPTTIVDANGNLNPALTTRLTHAASGEAIADTMLLLAQKSDPQGQGSALTYARRYAVLAMLGLVGDEDDDGQAASKPTVAAAKPVAKRSDPHPSDQEVGALVEEFPEFAPELPTVGQSSFDPPGDLRTDKQNKLIGVLVTKLDNVDETRAWMEDNFGKTSRASITKKEATALIDWLKEKAIAAGLWDD